MNLENKVIVKVKTATAPSNRFNHIDIYEFEVHEYIKIIPSTIGRQTFHFQYYDKENILRSATQSSKSSKVFTNFNMFFKVIQEGTPPQEIWGFGKRLKEFMNEFYPEYLI